MATNVSDINTRLVDISTQYSKFNKNQVLTETQLNGFLDYFDDQDRLTRTSLSGVGIVCGFKVVYDADDKTIKLTQGRGVTTDGDLVALQDPSETEAGKNDTTLKSINLSSKTFKSFKKFSDNKAEYKHFRKPDNTEINLWELFEEEGTPETSLSVFPNLSSMVVLLYLESYSKEGDLCTQLTCDNQGIEQVSKLRVLLVSYQNADNIIAADSIYKDNYWLEIYENLPEVSAKRIVLNETNSKKYKKLKKSYFSAIKETNTLDKLGEGVDDIFDKFGQNPISHKIHKLFDFGQSNIPIDFQYRYDVLKDLIDTYNEIKELLLDLNVDCCPNVAAFPKHLLLGRLVETKEYLTYRHSFYKSPIIASDNEGYKKVISLVKKIQGLAEEYLKTNKGDEIKITPSLTQAKLSDKTIPFYYNVTENFLEKWSFKTSKYLRTRYNLSYHRENLVNVSSVKNPLDYNLDPFDFYRIEGHQGKMFRDALDQINQIKTEKGLSFDVKVLSIETDKQSLDISEHQCHFEDLKFLLEAWRAEQDCVLSEVTTFLSGFSLDDPGKNLESQSKGLEEMTEKELEESFAMKESAEERIRGQLQGRYGKGRRQNIVLANLNSKQGAIGGRLYQSFEDYKNGSQSDIMLAIKNTVEELAQEEAWAQNEELKEFVLGDVSELLGIAFVLDNEMPDKITEINKYTLAAYKLIIDLLCKKVAKLQSDFETLNLSQGTKQYMGLLITQLSSVCCSAKKLEVLYEEIEARKEQILVQTQLCEFAKKHPGLEHKAGVIPGGTFVMVYLKEPEESEPTYPNVLLEIPFLEQPQLSEDGLTGERGQIELWEDKFSAEFTFVGAITNESEVPMYQAVMVGETLEQTVENLADFLNITWENADGASKLEAMANENVLLVRIKDRSVPAESYFMRFENPATVGSDTVFFFDANSIEDASITGQNTVIADFSLPYMCCSDCAPINFIIPKEPVHLSLPVSYVCLKEGETTIPLPFNVSPTDGVIKAKVSEGTPSGLTTDENGNPVFDASLTHESLHGEVIEFTVNDEETDCRITVYEDVPLAVTTNVVYNEMKTEAVVTYTVTEVYPNLSYDWNFGDGTTSNQVPTEGKIPVTYELPVENDNTIEPSLTVSNGFCEKDVPIEPITFEDNVEVSLDIIDKYCLDTTSDAEARIEFTNKDPQGAEIQIVGGEKDGIKIEGNELVLVPSDFQLYNTLIRFTLGGMQTNAKIRIGRIFAVEIMEDLGSYNWINKILHHSFSLTADIPNNIEEGEVTYKWMQNDQQIGSQKTLEMNPQLEKGTNDFEISVLVSVNGECISTKTTNVIIEYPNFRLRMPNNKTTFCLNDERNYLISVDPFIQGTIVEGNGAFVNANNQSQFNAMNTGMTTAGNVELGVAGESLLTLNLIAAPTASFTAELQNNVIVLTNNSDDADIYKWNVGGFEFERDVKQNERININRIDGEKISITLEVIGLCGSNRMAINNFEIRGAVEEKTCADLTKEKIIKDSKALPKNVQFDDENIVRKIIMPTQQAYKTFEEAPIEVLNSGNFNGIEGFTSLFSGTATEITNNVNNPDGQRLLSRYFIAQIKLYLNILHCQPHSVMQAEKASIVKTVSAMRSSIGRLVEFGVNFDEKGDLKLFLNQYVSDPQVIDYMKIGIKSQIIPML